MRIFTGLFLLLIATAAAAQQPCTLGTNSYRLDVPGLDYLITARVGGGHPHPLQVDTGSTGIAIWEAYIGDATPADDLGLAPYINYNSSGNTPRGRWVYTSVELIDRQGKSVVIPKMPVLAVHRVCPSINDCTITDWNDQLKRLQQLGMMGVGFDRGATMGGPRENAFLNVPGVSPGYIITPQGITLGVTAADVATFRTIPLQGTAPNWQQAPGCVTIAGASPSAAVCGVVLMDTGVDRMFVTYKQRPAVQLDAMNNLLPGTQVTVTWPTASSPVFSYAPVVPQTFSPTGTNPRFIHLAPNGTPPPPAMVFVNTSRQLLNQADYLYDATCGRIGFRPRPSP